MRKKKFKVKNIKHGGTNFSNYQQYGILCIKSLSYGILTNNQLESLRRSIVRLVKKKAVI
jgi:ribosomal protein L16/L10AE